MPDALIWGAILCCTNILISPHSLHAQKPTSVVHQSELVADQFKAQKLYDDFVAAGALGLVLSAASKMSTASSFSCM